MGSFSYKGLKQGRYIDGLIDALDKDEAIFKLKKEKIIISNIKEIGKKIGFNKSINWNVEIGNPKIPNKEILIFTKIMAVMLSSGINIIDALKLALDQTKNRATKKFITEAIQAVNKGEQISKVFEKDKNFDEVAVSLIKAGESTGRLDDFFLKLNDMQQKSADIKSKLKKAMMYPMTVLIIVLLVTIFMLIKVVPIFQKMYEGMGAQLPAPTRVVVSMSEFCTDPLRGGVTLISIIAFFIITKILVKKSKKMRRMLDKFYISIPIIGNIIIKAKIARFAMVMQNLSSAGVNIIEMLDISKMSIGNLYLSESVERIQRGVYSGQQIGPLFVKEAVFPKIFTQLVSIGEQSGNLDSMFGSAANYMDKEFSDIAENFNTILEPVIIVVMGVIVGGLLIALYTPMFSMGDLIQ